LVVITWKSSEDSKKSQIFSHPTSTEEKNIQLNSTKKFPHIGGIHLIKNRSRGPKQLSVFHVPKSLDQTKEQTTKSPYQRPVPVSPDDVAATQYALFGQVGPADMS
jgi:hypothetical protein